MSYIPCGNVITILARFLIHWTKNWICIKFAQRKYDAKICLLRSKPVAKAVKSIFGTIFAHQSKYGSKYGIYEVCYRFAPEQTYFCIIFALSKFDANPFFLPVIRFLYIGGRLQFGVVHPMQKCYYHLIISKVLNKILIHWW